MSDQNRVIAENIAWFKWFRAGAQPPLKPIAEECEDCGGDGGVESETIECQACDGSGKTDDGEDECVECEGSGEVDLDSDFGVGNCETCNGLGYVVPEEQTP